MKTIITIAALVAAASITTVEAAETNDAACKQIGELARTVMRNRQQDIPISQMIEAIEKTTQNNKGSSRSMAQAIRALVIFAYERPSYSVESNREQAVAEFGNEMELACFSQKD